MTAPQPQSFYLAVLVLGCGVTRQDVTLSRGVYMAAKLLAMERPNELLCIAIDGSDQSSYSVPYFKQVRILCH